MFVLLLISGSYYFTRVIVRAMIVVFASWSFFWIFLFLALLESAILQTCANYLKIERIMFHCLTSPDFSSHKILIVFIGSSWQLWTGALLMGRGQETSRVIFTSRWRKTVLSISILVAGLEEDHRYVKDLKLWMNINWSYQVCSPHVCLMSQSISAYCNQFILEGFSSHPKISTLLRNHSYSG